MCPLTCDHRHPQDRFILTGIPHGPFHVRHLCARDANDAYGRATLGMEPGGLCRVAPLRGQGQDLQSRLGLLGSGGGGGRNGVS